MNRKISFSILSFLVACFGSAFAQNPQQLTDFENEFSDVRQLQPAGNNVFFSAYSPDHGTELWVADAGGAGAVVLLDVTAGLEDFNLPTLEAFNGVCYFIADFPHATLWRSDGTPSGTTLLAQLPELSHDLSLQEGIPMVHLDGRVLSLIPTTTDEFTLWITDGTAAGTSEIWREPYEPVPFSFVTTDLVRLGGAAYFPFLDLQNNTVLYRTDGTGAGTSEVTVITESSTLNGISAFPGTAQRFFLFDQVQGFMGSDGTAAGTQALPVDRSPFLHTAVLGGYAYFGVVPVGSTELVLWKTDGTAAGSEILGHFPFSDAAQAYPLGIELFRALVTATNSAVYFFAPDEAEGVSLFQTDGESVTAVKQMVPQDIMWLAMGEPLVDEMVAVGNRVYFPANGDLISGVASGTELWTSDGTSAGTRMLTDLNPGAASCYPDLLSVDGQQLFFVASNGVGHQVWIYPGITDTPCAHNGGGLYEIGETLCLTVPSPVQVSAGFQWSKDGDALTDTGRIEGTSTQTLSIASLIIEDSGSYTCSYDDGSKAPAVYGPIPVQVVSQVPALTWPGLAVLAIVLAGLAKRHRK